jgi:ectoine hydroxylase-related dioxygenase (phytanoyl-CoA dioxygenase family)
VIFYLENTTVENGCTRVVPGTHLLPGTQALYFDKDERTKTSGILDQALPVPMPAGGMIAIDSTIIHGAGRNYTSNTRMSMTMGYHSVDELSDAENPKRALVSGERIYMGNDRKQGY